MCPSILNLIAAAAFRGASEYVPHRFADARWLFTRVGRAGAHTQYLGAEAARAVGERSSSQCSRALPVPRLLPSRPGTCRAATAYTATVCASWSMAGWRCGTPACPTSANICGVPSAARCACRRADTGRTARRRLHRLLQRFAWCSLFSRPRTLRVCLSSCRLFRVGRIPT